MGKKDNKKEESNGKIVFYTHEIKKNKSINEDTVKIISFIIILIVVLGLVGLLFILNSKYITKDAAGNTTTTSTTTTKEPTYDSKQVIVDTMFGIDKKATYYVLAYDSSEELEGQFLYNKAKSASIKDVTVYTLDLKNAMNKNYYNKDKNENKKPSKASEVNFKTNTLIIFKKGKVAEYITDRDEIIKKLANK